MSELEELREYANTLSEHIDSNAECLKRLMMIIGSALPYIEHLTVDLMNEWHDINHKINDELKIKLETTGDK